MKPSIGAFHDDGAAVIDLPRLLEPRMLIQANSGGGKSWAIRRLLEQTAGHVQQLVIDPEGEFATLREKYDYVIAAPHGGDALAHPKTAQILASRLLETGEALQDYWFNRLPEGERAILRVLVERYPDAVPRDSLTDETNYKRSTRDAYLQRLAARQLVAEPPRGEVRTSENLFA